MARFSTAIDTLAVISCKPCARLDESRRKSFENFIEYNCRQLARLLVDHQRYRKAAKVLNFLNDTAFCPSHRLRLLAVVADKDNEVLKSF